ncbi:TRAP transporter substrate-binding protein [Cohaesibacter celericrescens]|uniref:C4-dicarboxylate ABC transporter substrate-binding protein n=1 Tax=Cohaesibacter celericrescens TaxID=2067669 RepID=A0A2N5XVS1_9HYPH|nr:TRAP transporter substrate-binding protein [Cohaesibacter celericrescens]PLW78603.1 C4-dicarboxylate ABC transporter substrate-binding protein [Cohaesibacter celericrescens]
MLNSIRNVVCGAAAILATSALIMPTFASAVTLDLSEVLPESNYGTQNVKKFAEEVEKATDGNVKINVHAGGALGFKGPEHLRAVRDGLIPMADVLGSQQIGDEALFGLENVPFLVSSMADLKVLHKFWRPEIEKVAAKYNQKFLYYVPSPKQYMYLKVNVDTADKLEDIKIRGADKTTVDTMKAIGMAGVQIPWGELIPALASGRVEGVATSATSGVDGKFWEFLKYIYPSNHTWGSNIVSINLDTWNKLSADDQKAIEDTAQKLEPVFWDVARDKDLESVAKMQENGMEVVDIPTEMFADIQQRTKVLLEEYLVRVPEAKSIVDQYLAELGRE